MSEHHMISAEEAQALLKDATPGPWWSIDCEYRGTLVSGAGMSMGLVDGYVKDVELAAAAPDLARTVIAQADALEEIAHLRSRILDRAESAHSNGALASAVAFRETAEQLKKILTTMEKE